MKIGLITLASAMLILGILSMLTPLPGGTLLIAGGCALLICTSETAAKKIKHVRREKAWVNRPMTWMEGKLGRRLSGPMRRTRPVDQNSAEDEHCS